MSKVINKTLIAVTIFTIVIFLVIAGFSPVFAAENEAAVESESVIKTALDWIKSLSVDQIKGWIGLGIGYLSVNAVTIIILVIKIAYDSVKKAKHQIEMKEERTAADNRIIELCDKFVKSEEETKNLIIEKMNDFAKQYDIKLSNQVNDAVESQKKVLDEYADKIKELEKSEE